MLSLILIVIGVLVVCYSLWLADVRQNDHVSSVNKPTGDSVAGDSGMILGTVIIYYATQTGTAANFAKTLVLEGKENGVVCIAKSIEECSIEDLRKPGTLAVFLVSTHYEGEPTDDMKVFWKEFSKLKASNMLTDLKYTGFGLGDINYKYYCQMARLLNNKLELLGASKVYAFGEGSNHQGRIEEYFEEWHIPLWNNLLPHLHPLAKSEAADIWANSDPEAFTIRILNSMPASRDSDSNIYQSETLVGICDQKYLQSFEGEIVAIRELRQRPSETDSTLHVDIKLPEGVTYKTAENLKIYPRSNPILVNRLLNHLGLSGDLILQFESKSKLPFKSPISLAELLFEYLDIQGMLKKSSIKQLMDVAINPAVKSE